MLFRKIMAKLTKAGVVASAGAAAATVAGIANSVDPKDIALAAVAAGVFAVTASTKGD